MAIVFVVVVDVLATRIGVTSEKLASNSMQKR